MDKGNQAAQDNNSNNPIKDNPFATSANDTNNAIPSSGDPQLEALRNQVDNRAYATSSYDRANAFSVTNSNYQPEVTVAGSATSFGHGEEDNNFQFISGEPDLPPAPEPEPILSAPVVEEPVVAQPEPVPVPAPEPEPVQEELPPPAPEFEPAPVPEPAPVQNFFAPEPEVERKRALSLPLIILIVVGVIVLIGGAIFAFYVLNKKNEPQQSQNPSSPSGTISYEEYNNKIKNKEALNCTATYNKATHTGSSYAEGQYEIFSEKAWTIAADDGWKNVFISNYDFSSAKATDGSIVTRFDLKYKPSSIYIEDQTAYIWSVTKTPRAGGDGKSTYRLAESYEGVAPTIEVNREQVENALETNLYSDIQMSDADINDAEAGDMTITCKDADLSEFAELLKARKAEIGSNDN